MRNNKKALGLSPREAYDTERKAEIERRMRLEIEEEREDVQMWHAMEKLGVDQRPDGKRSNKSVSKHSDHDSIAKKLMNGCMANVAIVAGGIKAIFENITTMAQIAGASAAQSQTQASVLAAHDDVYIYDTVAVSAPTAHILNEEVLAVAMLKKELEAEQNPNKRTRLQMEFDDTVNYFDMRPHPVTGVYVHLYHHIELVERLNNEGQKLKCIDSVCFYLPKADIATTRGIKRGISDVYNQSPEEVELTHAEAKAQMALQPLAPAPRVS